MAVDLIIRSRPAIHGSRGTWLLESTPRTHESKRNTMAAEAAVIIGSGSIGVAIGRIVGIGRPVLLADHNEETMDAVAGQLRGEGYEVTTHPVDISNEDAVAALADTAASLGNVTRVLLAAPGGSGIVISSMAGHVGEGYPREVEHALAYTPTAELLDLPFLAAEKVGDSGAAYTLAKRGNGLRVQAAAITCGERGARINSLSRS